MFLLKKGLLPLFLALFISIGGSAQNKYEYTIPIQSTDGWATQNLFSLSEDSSYIYGFFGQLLNQKHKIHSALLVKNNTLVLEEYYGKHALDTQHDMRSVTKVFISLLAGISVDKGYIASIDDPISKYINSPVPEKNLDTRKEQITIRHLLTMSSGLDCNDWDKKSKGQEDKVYKKKDWLQYTLDLPMINEPGSVSAYCSMGVTLVAEAIRQASGMEIDVFADTHLFSPLGIKNVRWGHTSKKRNIPSSAKRLYMTPRDMAKIGQLILNDGIWDSKQVISKNWLLDSTSPHTKITNIDYGFFWWNIPLKKDEIQVNAITATGNGGQYIFIMKELNMVAVFTGGAYNSQDDKLPFAVVANVYLPTIGLSTNQE